MKKTSTHHRRNPSQNSGSKASLIGSSVFGAAVSAITLTVIILVSAVLCLAFDDPHRFVGPLCLFALYTAAFMGGFSAVKRNGGGALLCGALSGVMFMLLVWAVFAVLDAVWKNGSSGILQFVLKLSLIPVSVIGAVSGLSFGKNKHKRPKNF